jgi:hypothetical protein
LQIAQATYSGQSLEFVKKDEVLPYSWRYQNNRLNTLLYHNTSYKLNAIEAPFQITLLLPEDSELSRINDSMVDYKLDFNDSQLTATLLISKLMSTNASLNNLASAHIKFTLNDEILEYVTQDLMLEYQGDSLIILGFDEVYHKAHIGGKFLAFLYHDKEVYEFVLSVNAKISDLQKIWFVTMLQNIKIKGEYYFWDTNLENWKPFKFQRWSYMDQIN